MRRVKCNSSEQNPCSATENFLRGRDLLTCVPGVTFGLYWDLLVWGYMKQVALGFRAHSGWTALVAIALEDGSPGVLLRERPHLVKTFTYEFRQPYHTAKKGSPANAQVFIARVRSEARSLARQAISAAQSNLQHRGYELRRCGLLLASGRQLPELAGILASHALIHTADGELFREALLHASARCGIEAFAVKENRLLETASQTLQLDADALNRRLIQLGTGIGSPWTQDEKLAALVAWLSLANQPTGPFEDESA